MKSLNNFRKQNVHCKTFPYIDIDLHFFFLYRSLVLLVLRRSLKTNCYANIQKLVVFLKCLIINAFIN